MHVCRVKWDSIVSSVKTDVNANTVVALICCFTPSVSVIGWFSPVTQSAFLDLNISVCFTWHDCFLFTSIVVSSKFCFNHTSLCVFVTNNVVIFEFCFTISDCVFFGVFSSVVVFYQWCGLLRVLLYHLWLVSFPQWCSKCGVLSEHIQHKARDHWCHTSHPLCVWLHAHGWRTAAHQDRGLQPWKRRQSQSVFSVFPRPLCGYVATLVFVFLLK